MTLEMGTVHLLDTSPLLETSSVRLPAIDPDRQRLLLSAGALYPQSYAFFLEHAAKVSRQRGVAQARGALF